MTNVRNGSSWPAMPDVSTTGVMLVAVPPPPPDETPSADSTAACACPRLTPISADSSPASSFASAFAFWSPRMARLASSFALPRSINSGRSPSWKSFRICAAVPAGSPLFWISSQIPGTSAANSPSQSCPVSPLTMMSASRRAFSFTASSRGRKSSALTPATGPVADEIMPEMVDSRLLNSLLAPDAVLPSEYVAVDALFRFDR